MSEEGDFADSDKSDFSQKLTPSKQIPPLEKQISFSSLMSKQGMMDPPRQLPKRSYSLEPDMATGWKPKKIGGNVLNNVFPLTCSTEMIDYLIKQLYRKKSKQWQIAYLGPRKQNSYMLHQGRKYENPYPLHKKLQSHVSQRPQIPMNPVLQQKNLKFNSNFQCGNLDAAIHITPNQYDLFMRVDTNTKGHTNWYYFTVQNGNFVGSVRFNVCNFRRQKSLYQRGLKPYFYSKKNSDSWKQGGENVRYEKKPLRYSFLYEDEDYQQTLKAYITLTFTYHFDTPNDTVELAYFIPYSYSRLLKFLPSLQNCKTLPSLKSLSGLSIPILEITDVQASEYNKKVVIITSRIHPGEANSSFVCQGFLQFICSDSMQAKQFRKNFVAYVVPMINPDGVVAGNYRTSLFGKDLNRTFNQSRRFAFPETFHLLELIKDLKAKHKQKLNVFIDLHGHSVKKNIFMYGPEFNIQNSNYYLAKQLPKILSNLTPLFRFYSCIFRISSQKSTTARATLNRFLNIPFTYTMESSNGFYYDSDLKKQFELTSKKLKKMGASLCQALLQFKQVQSSNRISNFQINIPNYHGSRKHSQENQKHEHHEQGQIQRQKKQIFEQQAFSQNKVQDKQSFCHQINRAINYNSDKKAQQHQILSDDDISQGNSDSEPQDEDLSDNQLDKLLQTIQQGRQMDFISQKSMSLISPASSLSPIILENQNIFKFTKFSERQIKQKNRYKKKNPLLPPINCLNRAQAKQKTTKSFIDRQSDYSRSGSPQKQRRSKHMSISQMIQQARGNVDMMIGTRIQPVYKKQQPVIVNLIVKKKPSKMELQKVKCFSNNSPYNNINKEKHGQILQGLKPLNTTAHIGEEKIQNSHILIKIFNQLQLFFYP